MKIQKQLSELTDTALTTGLITLAIVTIFVALFVKNKYIKAGVLAFEILP